MKLTRALAVIVGAAMPLTTAVALAPTAGADVINTTVDVQYTCSPDATNNVGGSNGWTNTVSVSYPETVAPGETFNVTLRPGSMTANQSRTGRVTYDIQAPSNVTNLNATIGAAATGFNSGTAELIPVDPTSKTTATASNTFRIWGGTSAGFGTSTGTSTNSGLRKTATGAFQLPGINFTMRAPVTPGAEVVFGLPGAGASSAGNAANTQFSYTKGTGNNGSVVNCAVSANAAELAKITVSNDAPVTLDSNVHIIGGDKTADSSNPVQLQAQVAVPGATAAELAQSVVTFRQTNDNLIIGTAVPNASGLATITHQFDRIPDGEPDTTRTIVAEYSGIPGNINPSTADPIQLTLTAKQIAYHNTAFTVAARVGNVSDTAVTANVTASFTRPSPNFPADTKVKLFRDGVAVQEITMPASGTSVNFTDVISRGDLTTTHTYTVELVSIYHDYNDYQGSTQTPSTPIVVPRLGGDIVADQPTGSVDLGPVTGSLSGVVGMDVSPAFSPGLLGMLASAS